MDELPENCKQLELIPDFQHSRVCPKCDEPAIAINFDLLCHDCWLRNIEHWSLEDE